MVNEFTGQPYKKDNFAHLFSDIAKGAEVTDKQFRDLRRTAAVRLAEAGCTTEEVVAVTGHKIESGSNILETYLPRNAAMAANAIDKLESHKRGKVGTSRLEQK